MSRGGHASGNDWAKPAEARCEREVRRRACGAMADNLRVNESEGGGGGELKAQKGNSHKWLTVNEFWSKSLIRRRCHRVIVHRCTHELTQVNRVRGDILETA